MHLIYVIFSYVLFLALAPLLLLHRKTRGGLRERLGFYGQKKAVLQGAQSPRVWLHGASAGDLLALSPMIQLLRERHPNAFLAVSTITNTGHLMAQRRLMREIDALIYAPYDLPGATKRAIRLIRPDALILEYTEIWPNLIEAARRNGTAVVLSNGRFANEQVPKYRKLFKLIGNPLKKLRLFLMRDEEEADRAIQLGAPHERVLVTGNTKFDVLSAIPVHNKQIDLRQAFSLRSEELVLMAGSTHEGDEGIVFLVYERLLRAFPSLRLIIAPRYLERAERVASVAEAHGLSVGFRSKENCAGTQVGVLDTIGELSSAYGLATVVFVGGSFTDRGGQNILEPAALAKPVLFGPNMENFRDSLQVLLGRGGIQVNDADHFYRVAFDLLSKPETARTLGQMAAASVGQVSGASLKNVERIEKLLGLEFEP